MTIFIRNLGLSVFFALLVCAAGVARANVSAPPATQSGQSLTQLPDGRWMLAGGAQASQQILLSDPVSNQLVPSSLALNLARTGHSATVMPDGRVLVVGGFDDRGLPVIEAEVIDFRAGTTFVANLGLLARAYHTATLLADGRILIVGGVDARGAPLSDAELLNTGDLQADSFNGRLERARWQHLAQLLPSDKVLLFGGKGADGRALDSPELYDAATQRFSSASPQVQQLYQSLQGAQAPSAVASTPADGEWNVSADSRIVVQLSKWMQPASLNRQTVELACGGQAVAASVVPAERGLLLFISPRQTLGVASDCQLTIDGAQDALGLPLNRTIIRFKTRSAAETGSAATPPLASSAIGSVSSPDASTSATQTSAGEASGKQVAQPGSNAAASAPLGDQAATGKRDKDDFRLPMIFEQNRGQHDGKIKFSARGRGYRLHVADNETLFDIVSVEPKKGKAAAKATDKNLLPAALSGVGQAGKQTPRYADRQAAGGEDVVVTRHRIRLQLVGANPKSGIVGLDPLESKTHYLDASKPQQKSASVPHYGKLLQAAVYPGIDKLYYGQEGQLEYDWIVKPGADPGQIAQKIEGDVSLSIAPNGDLIVSVAGKTITQKKPIAFQTIDDKKVPVAAGYTIKGNTIKIRLGDYDKTKPLTIDPVIEFSTSIDALLSQGGGLIDMRVAGDNSVFMLVAGSKKYPSTNAVTLPGPKTLQDADNYLIKMRPGGQVVDFVTVFVNYSASNTSSSPYSAMAVVNSAGGPQAVLTGVSFDANGDTFPIVSKLTPAGDAYAFSRQINVVGGSGTADGGGSIDIDAAGSIYITGWSVDSNLGGAINTFWPYASNFGCALVKLSPDASIVQYQAQVRLPSCSRARVKVDSAGSPYLVATSDQPITPSNALIAGVVTPRSDGNAGLTYIDYPFVVKFSPNGDAIEYASYLFTQQAGNFVPFENVADIGLDATGNLYALGLWKITKYSPAGGFVYATEFVPPPTPGVNLGCNNSCIDFASLAVTPAGEAYSATAYLNPFLFNNSIILRFSTLVTKLNAAGVADSDPFYLYGFPNSYKNGQAIRLDSNNGVYVAGVSGALNGPSPTLFLTKIAYGTLLTSTPNPSPIGQTITLDLVNLGPAAAGWASFYAGGDFLGSVPVSGGAASFQVSSLAAGAHLLTAIFNGSTFSTSHIVKQSDQSTTTLLTGPPTVTENDPLVLQVQVNSGVGGVPTGTVAIMEGVVQRGTGVLNASGAVQITLPIQSKGAHQYVAAYQGDANKAPSNSTGLLVTVTEVPVTVAVTAPAAGATLSVPAPIPVTATLAMGAQTTIRSVDFYANGAPIGQATDAPFSASWQLVLPGAYTLTATATSDTGATYTSPPIAVTAVAIPGVGLVTYFHQDLSGNTIAATDSNGNVVYTEQYRPYGDRLTNDAASQTGQLAGNRIWFHGKVQDEATGLQYFGARYYDPVIGRFMGVDPAGFDPGNLHSANRYAYGNNNPYKYRDPDGRLAFPLILPFVPEISAATVAAIAKVTAFVGSAAAAAWYGNKVLNEAKNPNEGAAGNEPKKPRVDGEGSTPEQKENSVGGPSAGKPVTPAERKKILEEGKNADGTWTCWRCGQSTDDPSRIQIGHKNVPRSKGGNKHPDNLGCEGAHCNGSAGNRGQVKEGGDCKSKGGC